MTNNNLQLLKPTLIFSVLGFFIPGFTAFALLRIQMSLSYIGLECTQAWTVIISTASIGTIVFPILFYRFLKKKKENQCRDITGKLTVFNLSQYICIQAVLGIFFTNINRLCYGSDGQNGLEFVLTGWIVIPVLIGLSILFEYLLKTKK